MLNGNLLERGIPYKGKREIPDKGKSLVRRRRKYSRVSPVQLARLRIQGLRSKNHCLCSIRNALSNLSGAGHICPEITFENWPLILLLLIIIIISNKTRSTSNSASSRLISIVIITMFVVSCYVYIYTYIYIYI